MQFEAFPRYIEELSREISGRGNFMIPDYQRPYKWGIDECETLWNDIKDAFKEKQSESHFEYFLGSIVTYKNSETKNLDIIDGQQRITTLTLLFRAFYYYFAKEAPGEEQKGYLKNFGRFIWELDLGTDKIVFDKPFLKSEVITDQDGECLQKILIENLDFEYLEKSNSRYAKNFLYFKKAITDFINNTNNDETSGVLNFPKLCNTILGKTFAVLFVTCDSVDSAMTIFNTLNSRGMPLSNADIIKGYIYKNTKSKEEFAKKWKGISSDFEEYNSKDDMSVLFIQAMHVIRAINNYTDTTTLSVLDFFTKKKKGSFGYNDGYLVKQEKIDELMEFVEILVYFWANPQTYLSKKAYRYFNVLSLHQNDTWKFFVAFLVWRNKANFIKDKFNENFSKEFEIYLLDLLKAVTAKFLSNDASTNTIKELVFKMNAELNKGIDFSYNEKIFLPDGFMDLFSSSDKNRRLDTKKVKYILYLYAHIYDDFSSDIENYKLEVEHILPKTWQNINFDEWNEESHSEYLEQIGNKILLNKPTNIKCANNFFSLKQDKYKDSKNSQEVRDLGNRENKIWSKADIEARNKVIEKALRDFVTK